MDDITRTFVSAALEQVRLLERELSTLRERLAALVPNAHGVPFVAPDSFDLETIERLYIEQTLHRFSGNKTRAAGLLRVDPSTLHRKMARWGADW